MVGFNGESEYFEMVCIARLRRAHIHRTEDPPECRMKEERQDNEIEATNVSLTC